MNLPRELDSPVGPWETTTSIGGRCRARERYSRAVLRAREAWPVILGSATSAPTGPTIQFGRACRCTRPLARTLLLTRLPDPGCFIGRWLWRGGSTRSHPELGSENPLRGWYCRGHPVGEYRAAGLTFQTPASIFNDRSGRLAFPHFRGDRTLPSPKRRRCLGYRQLRHAEERRRAEQRR